MEKVIKKVIYSITFYEDLKSIYNYGLETFGFDIAEIFQEKILHSANGLSFMFLIYPECNTLKLKIKFIEVLSLENI